MKFGLIIANNPNLIANDCSTHVVADVVVTFWLISTIVSCPIIISRFMGGFCTFGIDINIGIDIEIGVDIEVDVGVWFCKMPKEWPVKLSSFNFTIVWASSSVLAPSY